MELTWARAARRRWPGRAAGLRAARRAARRPGRGLPAQHPRGARGLPGHRQPRRGVVVVRPGVRRAQRRRPASARSSRRCCSPSTATATAAGPSTARDEVAAHPRRAADARATSCAVPYLDARRGARRRTRLGELLAGTRRCAFEAVPFDHPLYVLFSSGTTGLPKAIVHGHGGIIARAPQGAGPAPRPRTRRPLLLVHHHRLDDVELPRVGPARRRGDRALRRRPGLARPGHAVGARRGPSAHRRSARARRSSWRAARRGSARRRGSTSRAARRRLDRRAAPGRGLRVGARGRGPTSWWRRSAAAPTSAPRSSGRARWCPVRAGEIPCRCWAPRWRPSTPTGQPVVGAAGRAGGHRADALDARGVLGRRRRLALPRRLLRATYPGVWRHGDWITITERGRASSPAAPTPRSTAAACAWARASSTRVVEAAPGCATASWCTSRTPTAGAGELLLFVALAPGVGARRRPPGPADRRAAHRAVAPPRARPHRARCRPSPARCRARSSRCR